MRTQIRGESADWTEEIIALWASVEPSCREYIEGQRQGWDFERNPIGSANYFTPRPWQNEYDRGSDQEGFSYVAGREVFQVFWVPGTHHDPRHECNDECPCRPGS